MKLNNREEEHIEKRRMVHKTKVEVVRWRPLIALNMELGGSDKINRAKRERPV
jgi:hypothetical protein